MRRHIALIIIAISAVFGRSRLAFSEPMAEPPRAGISVDGCLVFPDAQGVASFWRETRQKLSCGASEEGSRR